MKEKPRGINEPILGKAFTMEVVLEGFLIALATMIAYHVGLSSGDTTIASTMAFATLCLSRLLHGFNSRSKESIFKIGVFSNKYLWVAAIIGYLLLKAVLTFQPIMSIFEVTSLNFNQYSFMYGLSFMPIIIVQIYKLIFVK